MFKILLIILPEWLTPELLIAIISILINGFLTFAIFWVNAQLKEIEAQNHRPQIEVNRYRFYDGNTERPSFEVELSNFGSGAVDNLRGIAQAFPDDSEKYGSEPSDVNLKRTKAFESDWNAVRALGMAGHEENVAFICEASLRFTHLEEDPDTCINPFHQAVSDLAEKADNIRFKYYIRYDCKFAESNEPSEEVLDIIFPAGEDWDLEKALDDGWDYERYRDDKKGYRAKMV